MRAAISRRARAAQWQRMGRGQRLRQADVATMPAPTGGLNARDAWSEMDPQDAIELDNWFPGFGKCEMRGGSDLHAQLPVPSDVETLAELKLAAGSKLLAACGGGFWDVSAGGLIASPIGGTTAFANDRWQWAAMNDVLGLCNGANTPQTFDGTSKAAMTVSGSGLTVTQLVGINVFKARSYFWTGAEQSFWYSAVNTLGGALTEFPLGDVGTFGGVLTTMITWTRDGGDGMDDLAVFVMSSGEAIVYAGSDPGSADDWALVGVFKIGGPLGIRAVAKLGGDALLATTDGYSLLSKALPGGRGSRGAQVSDKIVKAALAAAQAGAGEFGWDIILYPRGQRAMINVPVPASSSWIQHVVNLATGAWCRFTGMPARCWSLLDDAPYFGGASGTVYQADTGLYDLVSTLDIAPSPGVQIAASGRQAFSYLGQRGRNKQVTMMGPLLEADGPIDLTLGLAADFAADPEATVQVTLAPHSSGAEWDDADWDEATWAASASVIQSWLAHAARGYAISPSIRVDGNTSLVSWNATRLQYERVGVT